MNDKKKSIFNLYYINIGIIVIVIILNMIIRLPTQVIISEVNGVQSFEITKKYFDYFQILSLGSIFIVFITLFISIIYSNRMRHKMKKRVNEFSNLFKSGNLKYIDPQIAETQEEYQILSVWNESISRINDITQKRETYFNTMIHDFKMPLQLLKSNVELYDLEYGDNEYVEQIDMLIKDLNNDINRILILEKIKYFESPEIEEVDIHKVVSDLITAYNVLECNFIITGDMHWIIETDVVMFSKILHNILDNAVKYKTGSNVQINISEDMITISNQCDINAQNINIFDCKRRESKYGNGLGSQIVVTYATILNLRVTSSIENHNFTVCIALNNN